MPVIRLWFMLFPFIHNNRYWYSLLYFPSCIYICIITQIPQSCRSVQDFKLMLFSNFHVWLFNVESCHIKLLYWSVTCWQDVLNFCNHLTVISITLGSSTRLYVKYASVSSPICQDMISMIWVLLVSIKFQPPMFLQNTVYCLWILCPIVWKHKWFHSYLICTKPQALPHEATTHSLVTTCNITLSTAGGKIWKPKQCTLQAWTCNVLNCVVFLSLSVHKHSCHITVHTCTYRHTVYLMTYSCPVWHTEYYRICSTFKTIS